MSYAHPSQSAFFDTAATASGQVGQKVWSYVILTNGTNAATIKFFKDVGLTDQIWEDTVLGADLARPHTMHANAPIGNPAGKGAGVYVEISVAAGAATCYVLYD